METQKKYHNLVLLGDNNDTRQIFMKKFVFVFLLFFAGIIIGAFLISLLHNKNKLTDSTLSMAKPSIDNITSSLPEITSSATSELQSITTIATPSKTDRCSIESLGRNMTQGCSVDDYAEIPLEKKPEDTATGITKLDTFAMPADTVNDSPPTEGVTNILDLQ